MQQKVAQVSGVGDVEIGGGSLPAVRIDLNLLALNDLGIPAEDVRAAIQASNATRPKGSIEDGVQRLQIYTQQPGHTAADYTHADGGLAQRRRRASCRTSPTSPTAPRTCARWACSTAARR